MALLLSPPAGKEVSQSPEHSPKKLVFDMEGTHMKKKLLIVLVVVMMLVALALSSAAARAASPEGSLNAGFHAGFSGGNANFFATFGDGSTYPDPTGGNGFFNAANNAIFRDGEGAHRIVPGFFDQVYCETDVFGIWWFIIGDTKDQVDDTDARIWFDGEELDLTTSAAKRWVNPGGIFDDPVLGPAPDWWMSIGVPVLGMLEPGIYLAESEVDFPGEPTFVSSAWVTILAEGDC